jgi:hypothetical protein
VSAGAVVSAVPTVSGPPVLPVVGSPAVVSAPLVDDGAVSVASPRRPHPTAPRATTSAHSIKKSDRTAAA